MKFSTLLLVATTATGVTTGRLGQPDQRRLVLGQNSTEEVFTDTDGGVVNGKDPYPNPPLSAPCTNPSIQCSNNGNCADRQGTRQSKDQTESFMCPGIAIVVVCVVVTVCWWL